MKMSRLQVSNEGSNWAADGGARIDCLSMAKKPKVRHKHKAGLRAPRLGVKVQKRWSSRGRMGRRHRGGVRMEMSAAMEQAGHLEGLQSRWSETYFLVEGPDSGYVVANATCR